jgi:2-isopropylmalate synthase
MTEVSPKNQTRRVEIYDTTLRDGTQGEGFNLSLTDKLQITQRLDLLGVDVIEGGFPVSNPKDEAYFKDIRDLKLSHAKISAFGMTRRRGMVAKDDPNMQALLGAQTPVVTIVGKTSPFQVQHVLNVTKEENLLMIGDSVKLMCEAGRRVVYDAEHFFDSFRSDADYALATLRAAQEAGADVLCLCDTNGGTLPEQVALAVKTVEQKLGAKLGIHTHNDGGLALANAMAGVTAGCVQAQGTINGVGERCGNMDLIQLIANLQLKLGLDCLLPGRLEKLTQTSRYVYQLANMNPVNGQPFVGDSAFAHKGGMHVHAVQKEPSTYEHVKPESVGNRRKILVSELSGVSNIVAKAGEKYAVADKTQLKKILQRVQDLEHQGYEFESAEASFDLLIQRELGMARPMFRLDHYRVSTMRSGTNDSLAEATVKLSIEKDGVVHNEHAVAEGTGPVDALNKSLSKALERYHPEAANLHLVDYRVRVINSRAETAAAVRVIVDFRTDNADGSKTFFATIGVDQNIIDASWQAIADAYDYHLSAVRK